MKKTAIIMSLILMAIMLSVNVLATGFSPSSLTYNLAPGEEKCQAITISSESETINISDLWAENKETEWKVTAFNESADYHGVTIEYDNELSAEERNFEVCISGDKIGEYHGVVLMKEEQEGNSIIQMGIWLKVIISETPTQTTSSGSSGGGGGSSSSSAVSSVQIQNQTALANLKKEESKKENLEVENGMEKGITGTSIYGSIGKSPNIMIIVAVIVLALLVFLMFRKNKEEVENYE